MTTAPFRPRASDVCRDVLRILDARVSRTEIEFEAGGKKLIVSLDGGEKAPTGALAPDEGKKERISMP